MDAVSQEAIAGRLGTLIDREWDGLDIGMQLNAQWTEPPQSPGSFVTIGHSIENYFFEASGMDAYLKAFFADHLPPVFFPELSTRFHQILALAIAYSLGLRSIQALTRGDGLISRKHVNWSVGRYLLDVGIVEDLVNRGVTVPGDWYAAVNSNIDGYLASYKTTEPGRWICHGHLGQQAIWVCIASLAREYGAGDKTVEAIERGAKDNKFRFCADCQCRGIFPNRTPLDSALEWLCT